LLAGTRGLGHRRPGAARDDDDGRRGRGRTRRGNAAAGDGLEPLARPLLLPTAELLDLRLPARGFLGLAAGPLVIPRGLDDDDPHRVAPGPQRLLLPPFQLIPATLLRRLLLELLQEPAQDARPRDQQEDNELDGLVLVQA